MGRKDWNFSKPSYRYLQQHIFGMTALLILTGCGGEQSKLPTAKADQIATADLSRAATLAAACSGCHVEGGRALADISNYSEARIAGALRTYRGDGPSAMHRIARGYSDDDIQLIAAYLGEPED